MTVLNLIKKKAPIKEIVALTESIVNPILLEYGLIVTSGIKHTIQLGSKNPKVLIFEWDNRIDPSSVSYGLTADIGYDDENRGAEYDKDDTTALKFRIYNTNVSESDLIKYDFGSQITGYLILHFKGYANNTINVYASPDDVSYTKLATLPHSEAIKIFKVENVRYVKLTGSSASSGTGEDYNYLYEIYMHDINNPTEKYEKTGDEVVEAVINTLNKVIDVILESDGKKTYKVVERYIGYPDYEDYVIEYS